MKLVVLAALFASVYSAGAIAADIECKGNPKIVDACWTVHGRLSAYNGAVPFVIWIVGTRHLLGVVDMNPHPSDEIEAVPESVAKLLLAAPPPRFADIFGDYEVCPLEKFRPGWMQGVCVEGASHLVVRHAQVLHHRPN